MISWSLEELDFLAFCSCFDFATFGVCFLAGLDVAVRFLLLAVVDGDM
jgi:hypothetical protein